MNKNQGYIKVDQFVIFPNLDVLCYMYISLGYHGDKGPLIVTDSFTTPFADAFLVAGQELGYKALDVNGESQYGR